jgi:hypothetical protein
MDYTDEAGLPGIENEIRENPSCPEPASLEFIERFTLSSVEGSKGFICYPCSFLNQYIMLNDDVRS